MVVNLLDIAPISSWEQAQRAEARKKAELEKKKQEELLKEKEKAEKEAQMTKKEAKKAKKKAEKAKKKAEKKAKKAEKQAGKNVKNLSTTAATVTTVEVPEGQACETTCAAMPTGVVLAVCASLLICFGSAWLFRRFNSDSSASE